jgi:hypothetical protein
MRDTTDIILGIASAAVERIYSDFPPAYMGNRRWSHIRIIETAIMEALNLADNDWHETRQLREPSEPWPDSRVTTEGEIL